MTFEGENGSLWGRVGFDNHNDGNSWGVMGDGVGWGK
jgi:hypothetical protein